MVKQGPWLGRVPMKRFMGAGAPLSVTDASFSGVLSAPQAIVEFWSPT